MSPTLIENANTDLWDDLISHSQNATLFHTSTWLDASPGRWNKMVLVDGDKEPLAGIALENNDFKAQNGHSITPYEGLLLRDDLYTGYKRSQHRFSLVSEFETILAQRKPVSFMTSPWLNDLRAFIIARWQVELLYTNVLNQQQLDDIDRTISPANMRRVKAALKEGVTVEINENPDIRPIEEILDLAQTSYSRQTLSLRFNRQEAATCFKIAAENGNAFFVTAKEHDGEISCGVGIFEFNGKAHLLISGQSRDISSSGNVNLAIYTAINHAKKRGASEFDFEGSFIDGIDRFFRGFGGNPMPFYEVRSP